MTRHVKSVADNIALEVSRAHAYLLWRLTSAFLDN